MKVWQSLNPDKITSEELRKYLFTGKFNRIFENHLKAGQMKYFNFIILTAVICIIIIPCGYCQNSQYGFDTIHILKQKRNRNIYQFIDSGSLEIHWGLILFCEGHLEKDRERVKNEDGSWSSVTGTTGSLYWDRNATGIILENRDTISSFLIITAPWTYPLLKKWAPAIENVPPAEA